MKRIIGIDLGTSNTAVYCSKRGVIFNEPTVVAVNKKTQKVVEVGYLAAKMIGKVPLDLEVTRPLKRGVVANVKSCVLYLKKVLSMCSALKDVKNGVVLFSYPSEATEVEKSALRKVGKALGADHVILNSTAKLAAYGAGLDLSNNRGAMVVNVGGGVTDCVVLSGNKVVINKNSFFSGNMIDEAIIRHLRTQHHLVIGTKTGEFIKMKIGSVEQLPENRLIEVTGKDIISSLPHSVVISTMEMKNVLIPIVVQLIETITDCLEVTPPEIASDIIENGILLTGGTAILAGLREHVERAINVPVRIAPEPINCCVNGFKKKIEIIQKSK